jgi:hypothetical protein
VSPVYRPSRWRVWGQKQRPRSEWDIVGVLWGPWQQPRRPRSFANADEWKRQREYSFTLMCLRHGRAMGARTL